MTSEALKEILNAFEERSDEIRCFCPQCGQMSLMTKHEDDYYTCRNCPYEFDRFETIEEYNKMRFLV